MQSLKGQGPQVLALFLSLIHDLRSSRGTAREVLQNL